MRSRTGTVFTLSLLAALALGPALPPSPVLAQQRRGRAPAAREGKTAERARRAEAAALLVETADKARSFDDLFYRARVQALAAEALWPLDERQARAIFRRAWEAAEASDKADREEAAQEAGALPGQTPRVTDARDEVLRKAAALDSRLAETFLRSLAAEKDESAAQGTEPPPKTAWGELSPSGARRLALAYELLEAGETRRAGEVAAPLVSEGVSANLIAFILRLRDRSVTEADTLYLGLLERAAANSQTDFNAVLLLSSPVISPQLMVVVDNFGSLQFRALPPAANAATMQAVTHKAWTAFYNLAARVLSRPLSSDDGTYMMPELVGRFYATGRLLPFYENTSAAYGAYAPTLRLRHSELFNLLEGGRREQLSSQFELTKMAATGNVDPLRSQTDELAHATDPQERASIALGMARAAVRYRFWDRARRAAAEIEDESLRARVLSFIQIHQIKDLTRAYEEDKEDDFESVARFARGADAPPFAKAWGLAQAAVIAARKKALDAEARQAAAAELINEAEGYASRVAQGTRERVAAYGVVTIAAARAQPARAWGMLRETVKAANAVEDFTGDESSFEVGEVAGAEEFNVEAEVFRLDQIFATMARLDFDKALAEARALEGGEPQAFATVAVAKSRMQESEVRSQNTGVRSQKE